MGRGWGEPQLPPNCHPTRSLGHLVHELAAALAGRRKKNRQEQTLRRPSMPARNGDFSFVHLSVSKRFFFLFVGNNFLLCKAMYALTNERRLSSMTRWSWQLGEWFFKCSNSSCLDTKLAHSVFYGKSTSEPGDESFGEPPASRGDEIIPA